MTPRRCKTWLLVLVCVTLLGAAGGWRLSDPLDASFSSNWLTAFIAPMHEPLVHDPLHDDAALRFDNISLRQFVPLAFSGNRVRLRLSNEFGDAPLVVGAMHVAWRQGTTGARIRAESDRTVLFAGQRSIEIPPGAIVYSDPVQLADHVPADLAVSFFLPVRTPRASWHLVGSRSSYRSIPGNHVGKTEFPVSQVDRSLFYLSAVEVESTSEPDLWIAFGDSITDGAWHTVDTDSSFPALWAKQWKTRPGGPLPAVLNAGIGGNRLLADRTGPSGLTRFNRDVLDVRGVRGVVMLIGINDLGGRGPDEQLPMLVGQLIAAQTDLARRARAKGLAVIGSTLTPVGGSVYGVPGVEAARQQFNRWMRDSTVFDGVVDFDGVIRDPLQPDRIRPEWTSDQLHPNDAGYRVMAEAVVRTLAEAGLERR